MFGALGLGGRVRLLWKRRWVNISTKIWDKSELSDVSTVLPSSHNGRRIWTLLWLNRIRNVIICLCRHCHTRACVRLNVCVRTRRRTESAAFVWLVDKQTYSRDKRFLLLYYANYAQPHSAVIVYGRADARHQIFKRLKIRRTDAIVSSRTWGKYSIISRFGEYINNNVSGMYVYIHVYANDNCLNVSNFHKAIYFINL